MCIEPFSSSQFEVVPAIKSFLFKTFFKDISEYFHHFKAKIIFPCHLFLCSTSFFRKGSFVSNATTLYNRARSFSYCIVFSFLYLQLPFLELTRLFLALYIVQPISIGVLFPFSARLRPLQVLENDLNCANLAEEDDAGLYISVKRDNTTDKSKFIKKINFFLSFLFVTNFYFLKYQYSC